jgi:hypothetical protein
VPPVPPRPAAPVLEHREQVDGEHLFTACDTGVDTLHRLVDLVSLNTTRRGIVELFTVLSAEATAADHPAHAFFVQRYRTTLDAVAFTYDRVRLEGALRPEIDPRTAAGQLVALMDGLQIQWLLADCRLDMPAQVGAHIAAQLTVPF